MTPLWALAWLATWLPAAQAQSASLFRQDLPVNGHPLTLADSSWSFEAVEPPRPIKLHDIITVLVEEKATTSSEANLQRRKQGQLDAELKDWPKLEGLTLKASPQPGNLPKVNGTLQSQLRTQGNLQTAESVRFKIASTVVYIRPNGHLVLEGHRTFINNEEQWDLSISGIVNPDDVLPNRTVLSEDLAESMIHKHEKGQVRDSYRRGWIVKLLDKYGMF
jgi:flagellar L-ring protein precursor FlgH